MDKVLAGKLDTHGIKRIAAVVLATAASGAILFVSAGRLDWTRAWIYLAVYLGSVTVSSAFLAVRNPELLNERGKRHSNTESFE